MVRVMYSFITALLVCTILVLPSLAQTTAASAGDDGDLDRGDDGGLDGGDDGGLDGGDVAAVILGCLLLILVIATAVLCLLYQKGYLGNREDQVLPLFPEIHTTPESLRQHSVEAIEHSSKKRKYQYLEKDPIIYMHEDIYYPPKSRPLPTNGTTHYPELVLPDRAPRRHRSRRRSSRKRGHSSWSRHTNSQITSPKTLSIASYPDDAVFVSEKGGMKFTMYYETRSPYADKNNRLSKTF